MINLQDGNGRRFDPTRGQTGDRPAPATPTAPPAAQVAAAERRFAEAAGRVHELEREEGRLHVEERQRAAASFQAYRDTVRGDHSGTASDNPGDFARAVEVKKLAGERLLGVAAERAAVQGKIGQAVQEGEDAVLELRALQERTAAAQRARERERDIERVMRRSGDY